MITHATSFVDPLGDCFFEKYKCERVERPRPSSQVSGPLPASTGNPNFIGPQIGGEKKRRATENEKSALGKYQIEFGMPR